MPVMQLRNLQSYSSSSRSQSATSATRSAGTVTECAVASMTAPGKASSRRTATSVPGIETVLTPCALSLPQRLRPESRSAKTQIVASLAPFQRLLAPGVHVAQHEDGDEGQRLDESDPELLWERHRPRVEEDDFHVEDNENQGDEVVAEVELHPAVALG